MPALIRVSLLRDRTVTQGGVELLHEWAEAGPDTIWVDITNPTQEDIEPLLEEWFRFHELATEDSLSPTTLPKYDRFKRYDFFVFRSIDVNIAQHGVETLKLACFLGANYVFTIHRAALQSIDSVWHRIPHDGRIMRRGPDFLLYSILDFLVDSHFPALDEIEERIDEIHEMIFNNPSQILLDELLHLKRDLNVMRRHSLPQRELFNQISRGDTQFIKSEHLIYFRDLYDHMFRIGESIDVERDLATTTMEAYLSVVANRTNDIMKVLTIFSSILLPINVIAGIYGMNFEQMPELRWPFGYAFALSLMGTVVVVLMIWFWRRGWIRPQAPRWAPTERSVARALRRRVSLDGTGRSRGPLVGANDEPPANT
jgi:magnesium transporter